jgi:parallel beta-helix repeat protein
MWRLPVRRKPLLTKFLVSTLVVSVFILVNTLSFGTASASTNVIGIISSDTTWNKANSPYTLTGPTAVSNGVTLTIEPGVTVNLGAYYLQVNGTLCARGSSTDSIIFSSQATSDIFQILFTPVSSNWNEQTGSGSIIENAIINASISITGVSPKINNNFIRDITASMMDSNVGIAITGGSPVVSGNHIIGGVTVGGEGSSLISNNTITGGMGIYTGTHVISNNNISGGSSYFNIGRDFERNYDVIAIGNGGSPVISANNITGNSRGISFYENAQSNAVIVNNRIYDCGAGIYLEASDLNSVIIQGNALMNNSQGIYALTNVTQTIERNLIINNTNGIQISSNTQLTIRNNTIANNSVGISTNSLLTTIIYNNIHDNSNYNIYLESDATSDINATYNWWGTTDLLAINQSIYDKKRDFNLGTVTFVPFLTEPNSQAMPDPNAPMSTPIPTASPSPSPTQTPSASASPTPSPSQNPTPTPVPPQKGLSGTEIAIITALIIITSIQAFTLALVLKKKR